MKLACPGCGMTNLPYEAECGKCGRELLSAAEAEAKRREWDAFPPPAREEFEANFRRNREAYEGHLAWLRRYRRFHAGVAAVAVSFVMNAILGFPTVWTLFLFLLPGAGAGLLLNLRRGGAYRGMGLFVAASVLTAPLLVPFVNMAAFWSGHWLFTAIGIMVSAGIGYYAGLKMDLDHRERGVLR